MVPSLPLPETNPLLVEREISFNMVNSTVPPRLLTPFTLPSKEQFFSIELANEPTKPPTFSVPACTYDYTSFNSLTFKRPAIPPIFLPLPEIIPSTKQFIITQWGGTTDQTANCLFSCDRNFNEIEVLN